MKPLIAWAIRDLMRRPLETGLLALAFLLTVSVTATPLWFTQAMSTATARIFSDAPSLIVRKFDALGWTPIPSEASVDIAESIPGVIAARPRIWGRVAGPEGAMTVIGGQKDRLPQSTARPRPGEALLGTDVKWNNGSPLTLVGQKTAIFSVIGRGALMTGMVEPNLVLLHIDDARELLGIPAGYATDLAIDVFNPAEEDAIIPDLNAAFPWTVRVTTRAERTGIQAALLSRMGGAATALLVPALLALGLLATVTVRDRFGRRFEIGLLKSLGWTTGDIVRLQVARALLVAVPGTLSGVLLASGLVFWGGATWPGRLCSEWPNLPARVSFSAGDAGLLLLEVTGLVALPFLAATIGTALRCATADPQEMLERTRF
jgi:hypothetical protein